MSKQVKKTVQRTKKKNPAFNSKGSSTLATTLGVMAGAVLVAIIGFLFQISAKVNDINAGKVADGRLSSNVANYNDPAPTFKHYVKAPGFVGYLVGNADSATKLVADPTDCDINAFATGIDAFGNLSCSADGGNIVNVNAVTLQGYDASYFQDASNISTGTLADSRLSSKVTLQGNSFNGANQLVQLTASGTLPNLSGENLYALNASNLSTGTVADARLSGNVALYNAATPTFTSPVTAPAFNGNLNGNALTATALAADPADCAIGAFANAISSTGDLTCSTDGAALVNLDAASITTGTLDDARLSTNVTVQGNLFNGADQLVQLDAAGALPALDGAALTNLTGANVTGVVANANEAVNFTGILSGDVTGTQGATVVTNVSDSALSANVALLNGANGLDFTGGGTLIADAFVGDGSGLTGITVATATALAADPADCAAGEFANAIAANGDLSCSNDGFALTNLNGANVVGPVADATNAVNATTAINFTGTLSGDVTGTQGATVVTNVEDAALSANVALLDGANGLDFTGGGAILADAFTGDGSGLTNLTGANVTGTVANANQANTALALATDPTDCAAGEYANAVDAQGNLSCSNDGSTLLNLDASNISAGTLNDLRLSNNVTLAGNTFNGALQLVQLDAAGAFTSIDAGNLTNLNGASVQGNIAGNAANVTGVVADANVDDALTINGGTIDNTVIGGTTPASGTFTTLNTTGAVNTDSLAVANSATIGNSLTVTGVTTLNGVTTINNSLTVTGAANLSSVNISGTTNHAGASTFNGTATFNNTLSGNAGVNFSAASSMRVPVTAVNITNGVTSCTASGSGAITFSTNGGFYGCDGTVWRQLNN